MQIYIISVLLVLSTALSGQHYPFGEKFTPGTIILKDSTEKIGLIKYPLYRNEKIGFREVEKSVTKRYAAKQLIGFKVDTFYFASMQNFKRFSSGYPFFKGKSKIKNVFGRQIRKGKINAYLVYVHKYNPISRRVETYPNIVFEKQGNGIMQYSAYPYEIRMSNRKYEKAKKNLYTFFNEYPEVVERIRIYNKGQNFMEIINMVGHINEQALAPQGANLLHPPVR